MKLTSTVCILLASTSCMLPQFAGAFAPSNSRSGVMKVLSGPSPLVSSSKYHSYRPSPRVPVDVVLTSTATTSEDGGDASEKKTLAQKIFAVYTRTASIATTLFPVWTVLFTLWALKKPQDFAWFTTEYFTAGLAALMLSMGITLTPNDFVQVAKEPVPTLMQFLQCYAMMPALALLLGTLFGLEPALVAGMVLVGSINGGQASNLCTYIARGNVALSVLMTTATTIGAIIMTPLLCKSLLGAVVPVDAVGIARSTIEVVLAPIAIGMTTNKFFPKFVEAILPISPVVGVVSTCLLVASAVAQVSGPILSAGLKLQIPILLLHLLGGVAGYAMPRLTGFDETTSRTMAIETSMKSSAFGFLLAKLHFGNYAARVPSAVSVVWMALTGSMLAVVWRRIPVDDSKTFNLFAKKKKEEDAEPAPAVEEEEEETSSEETKADDEESSSE